MKTKVSKISNKDGVLIVRIIYFTPIFKVGGVK